MQKIQKDIITNFISCVDSDQYYSIDWDYICSAYERRFIDFLVLIGEERSR